MTEEERTESTAPPEQEEQAAEEEKSGLDPEIQQRADEMEPEGESRMGSFLRKALRWVVAVVVVFALGVLAAWALQIRPQSQRIQDLRSELETSRNRTAELESEVQELRPLVAENQALEQELVALRGRLDLLSVLVDVTTAQLELEKENPAAAKEALATTEESLEDMQERLTEVDADTVRDLISRVNLVLNEVDEDLFAAQRDLEILANSLLSLERSLFGE